MSCLTARLIRLDWTRRSCKCQRKTYWVACSSLFLNFFFQQKTIRFYVFKWVCLLSHLVQRMKMRISQRAPNDPLCEFVLISIQSLNHRIEAVKSKFSLPHFQNQFLIANSFQNFSGTGLQSQASRLYRPIVFPNHPHCRWTKLKMRLPWICEHFETGRTSD